MNAKMAEQNLRDYLRHVMGPNQSINAERMLDALLSQVQAGKGATRGN